MPPIFVPQGNAEMVAIARNVTAVSRVPHLNNGSADLSVAAVLLGLEYKGMMELSRAKSDLVCNERNQKGRIDQKVHPQSGTT
jgi:hypothetical protein